MLWFRTSIKQTIVSKSGPCQQEVLFGLYPAHACGGATKQRETTTRQEFTRSSASNSLGLQRRGPTSRSSSRRLREAAGSPTLQDRWRGRWGKKERRFLRSARNRSVLFRFVLFCCVLFCPVRFCSVLFRVRQKTTENKNVLFCFV